jgi:hypothetical protein
MFCKAQHGATQFGIAQHDTHGTNSTTEHGIDSTARRSTTRHSTAQHSTAQHGILQQGMYCFPMLALV